MPYVLIVDDEPDSSEFVSMYLRKHGYNTRCVANGRAALRALVNQTPDAVVLDVLMPEMDGISLLEVMRSYLRWYNIPILLLTAHANKKQMERARQLGVEHIFQKTNFTLVQLEATLQKVLPPGANIGHGA
jgi:CheY-like chemotaxis protein